MLLFLLSLLLATASTTIAAPVVVANTTTTNSTTTSLSSWGLQPPCTPSSPCTGTLTHWAGGLGACGLDVNTRKEHAIALSAALMGPLSNSNPFCGRSVTVRHPRTGKTASGVVREKCMGCGVGDLDLTDLLFGVVSGGQEGQEGPEGVGIVEEAVWWFG